MIKVEIADNPNSWEKGLMFRESLEEESGMLFKFKVPKILKFWGLNTFIPLDIAFVDDSNTIIKIDKIKPLSMKSISSDYPCKMAIETNIDFFAKNGIKAGDKVKIEENKDETSIDFEKSNRK